jgi:enolase-phosphatase E1
VSSLKALQGFLWRTGYENGSLVSPLYPDVAPELTAWKDDGKNLAIFSSGSVNAQKLFFSYTGIQGNSSTAKDLKPLFGGRHFDTVNAGPKSENQSYLKIANEMGVQAEEILFLSDNVNGELLTSLRRTANLSLEVRAALAAGLKSLVVDRPGNPPLTEADRKEFTIITSFVEISLA